MSQITEKEQEFLDMCLSTFIHDEFIAGRVLKDASYALVTELATKLNLPHLLELLTQLGKMCDCGEVH